MPTERKPNVPLLLQNIIVNKTLCQRAIQSISEPVDDMMSYGRKKIKGNSVDDLF